MISSDVKPTTFAITCQEPGCSEYIHYTREDSEVPRYCWKHRSREGRHAAVRHLKRLAPYAKPDPVPKSRRVILLCMNRKCKCRDEVPASEWLENPHGYTCALCGGKMLYHKDVEEKSE